MKIVYIISHGHTARGAFQTNVIGKLVKAGFEVVVISRKGTTKLLETIVIAQGAKLVQYNPKESKTDAQLSNFRAYVHQDIRKNPALWEKHQRRVKDSKASLKRRFMNRSYFILGETIRKTSFLKKVYFKFEKRLFYNPEAEKLLISIKPDAIISTRPVDRMEAELLISATRLGIKKIMYILSWDNITSKGIFPELADYYLTWGEIMNAELKEYYHVEDKKLITTGVTHFDIHANVRDNLTIENKWFKALELSENKPYLLFTMSASYYAPNEIDIIEWLANKIDTNIFGDEMQLIIRPHMLNFMERASDLSWKNRLEQLKSKKVSIDFPEVDNSLLTWYMKQDDMLKLSHLINGSSLCINSGSTISIEALLFDKPVILTIFDTQTWPEWLSVRRIINYEHLRKLFAFNACTIVSSFEELEKSIKTYLIDPTEKSKERKNAVAAECYQADGLSTDRFVENIKAVMNK